MPAPLRFDIISIGCLSRNKLWGETDVVRTPHATTTLIRSGKRNILVDPGLPPVVLAARLQERAGLKPDQIDTIFLTNFRPSHRGGLSAFPKAKVLLSEREQQSTHDRLANWIAQAPPDDIDRKLLVDEMKLLDSMHVAPDKLADNVDLFPLPGYTEGTCGLLLSLPTLTVLLAGDAVPTLDHFLAGQTLPDAQDFATALEALREAYEIADLIIPGHDNLFLNPRTQGM